MASHLGIISLFWDALKWVNVFTKSNPLSNKKMSKVFDNICLMDNLLSAKCKGEKVVVDFRRTFKPFKGQSYETFTL